jgi:hypothetical protein
VTIPVFTDLSPRFGVAYDLFGNGKTALKANFGKYVQSFSSNLGDDYNPMGGAPVTAAPGGTCCSNCQRLMN